MMESEYSDVGHTAGGERILVQLLKARFRGKYRYSMLHIYFLSSDTWLLSWSN